MNSDRSCEQNSIPHVPSETAGILIGVGGMNPMGEPKAERSNKGN